MIENLAFRMEVINLIQNKNPVMFDAVLAALDYADHGDANRAIENIPLRKIDGINCGSQLFLETDGNLRREETTFCSSVHRSVNNYELFDRVPKIDIGRHPSLQNTNDSYEVLYPQAIWFSCQGDLEKILSTLEHLTHIGAKRSVGFGEITQIEVFRSTNPNSGLYFIDKTPQRMFPLDMLPKNVPTSSINVIDTTYQPPYYLPNSRVACFMPRNNVFSQEQLLTKLAVNVDDKMCEPWRPE